MCEPTTIALAISAASAAAGYVQADDSARRQQHAIEDNLKVAYEGAAKQADQINAASSQQMSERAKEAQREMSRLQVIAGETGALGGVSADRIMNESQANLGSDMAALEANRRNQLDQVYQEAKAGRSTAGSELASIKQPSLIGTGLQIAGGVASTEANMNAKGGTLFYKRNSTRYGIDMPDDAPNRGGQ